MLKHKSENPASDVHADGSEPSFVAEKIIDITGDICPMTFVRTRLALDRLPKGAVLCVRLLGDEPRRNVPRTAEAQGHIVLHEAVDEDGVILLWLRRG